MKGTEMPGAEEDSIDFTEISTRGRIPKDVDIFQ
jgi:hypothetical protein